MMRLATGVSWAETPATEMRDLRKGRMSLISFYPPPNAVGDGVTGVGVLVEVDEGVMGVLEGVTDGVGVFEGVTLGVMDGVNVKVGVLVLGWKGVSVMVGVKVGVGEGVSEGVGVMVPVKTTGVPLMVGVAGVVVMVSVRVGVAVARESGAKESAIKPAQ